MNDIVWLVFDSARFDTFAAAATPAIDSIGAASRRFSYASWTAPSHATFLMGLTPHQNVRDTFASVTYRNDLLRWRERVDERQSASLSFEDFLPRLSLPAALATRGYRCEAYVSLPVLNPSTLLSTDFDVFRLMPSHNDLGAIVDLLTFDDTPRFVLINAGETHYPYLVPGETAQDLPRLSGLHGTFRDLDDFLRQPGGALEPVPAPAAAFREQDLRTLWEKQVACIEHLDRVVERLLAKLPERCWIIVTSDHGELFGEDGFFGHGPVCHEKVFEVFFVEGRRP